MQFPQVPGVYIFKDAHGKILYVGKAKNLNTRIKSYFSRQKDDWKVHELIREHAKIDYIATHSEEEASLLEAELIRDFTPKYNTLLTSGDPFLYIVLTGDKLPVLKIVRIKGVRGTYFGPFMGNKKAIRAALDSLMRTFQLTLCKRKIEQGCLEYHLGRCAGTCLNDFDETAYRERLKLAVAVLENKPDDFIAAARAAIARHSSAKEFEKARHIARYLDDFESLFHALSTKFSQKKYAQEIVRATSPLTDVPDISVGMRELQKHLGLEKELFTIDCFDVSHTQGKDLVGASVRFTHGIPDKDECRRFKIRSLTKQNDYAALQEIVKRRYKKEAALPDIVLIDGGKGQRNAIVAILPNARVISLAKREERLFSEHYPEGFVLDLHSAMGKLLIALRDYAHHFAISYHKLLRKKGATL